MKNTLPFIENDPWLWPVASCIENRHLHYANTLEWIRSVHGSLYNFSSAHLYYGLHYDKKQKVWIFRDYLPNAKDVFLTGDFNGWDLSSHPLHRLQEKGKEGDWEIVLNLDEDILASNLQHGTRYKIYVHDALGNWKMRMPAYTFYAIQDPNTKDFSAVVWQPARKFAWGKDFVSMLEDTTRKQEFAKKFTPLIYEAHIGMAQETESVGSYREFAQNILPRIKDLGYNTVQLMGIAEHPYYGSFGYHVSNFYAPSSRFGTPDDLRFLIRKAHQMGLLVIMDLVHAHFVENTNEGLYALDGSPDLYNYPEPKGTHPYWGSKMFHFGRNQVRRFLLSNLRYWVEEFHLDGFRFDGVSAMIYFHRGYVDVFGTYENYFGNQVDEDALIYLSLANDLIHEITGSKHLSIAEEVSGMPGMTVSTFEGGTGFDYRLSMGIPDFWIRWIKERQDEDWVMRDLWEVMNHRMSNVPQITYCESHDQALVGDQTLAFRLMGSAMYTAMDIHSQNPIIDRGLALHKMIRLFTLSLGGGYGGYLNFMGNEFGHPEWIDFPRKDNQWSYKYARRQWSLLDNSQLKYQYLYAFDKAMIDFATKLNLKTLGFARERQIHEENKTIVFDLWNGLYVLVFNWHVNQSVPDYHIPVAKAGKYISVLNSDDKKFGGFGRVDNGGKYFTFSKEPNAPYLSIYNINRAVQVFQWIEE